MIRSSADSPTYSHNDFPDVDDVEPVGDADMACFAEVRDVLKRHGKLERFGLALLHKHFDLLEGEILLEETDVSTRQQFLRPIQLRDVVRDGSIDTLFALVDIQGELKCYKTCNVTSGSHTGNKDHSKMGDGKCVK